MGCRACSDVEKNDELLLREILRCIQSENTSGLAFYLKVFIKKCCNNSPLGINSKVINLNDFCLSFLGYAFVVGSVKCFRVLNEKFSASIPLMIENFSEYSMSTLNILCEKNHFQLLKHYLPLFFKYRPATLCNFNDTLDFQNTKVFKDSFDPFTPIQVACLYGSIPIVDYLYTFNLSNPSPNFDIEALNEDSGENCALLSVRSGSIGMVQMLHKKYNQDFSIKNKYGESALQICAVSSSKRLELSYLETFTYLVEEVKVSLSENYEEILIVLKDKDLVRYYEEKLNSFGIKASKKLLDSEVDLNSRIMPQRPNENKAPLNDSIANCSFGSTIFQNLSCVSFVTSSIIGSKGWIT